jgi:hypothetical protein
MVVKNLIFQLIDFMGNFINSLLNAKAHLLIGLAEGHHGSTNFVSDHLVEVALEMHHPLFHTAEFVVYFHFLRGELRLDFHNGLAGLRDGLTQGHANPIVHLVLQFLFS